jgi:prevent-host-death family protein
MRTVKIGKLKNQLSAYLRHVRNGEEVLVLDRDKPVARILPFDDSAISEEEARLVASGAMKLPEREMDWDAFFALPKANVPREVAIKALIESRGNR